MESISLKDSQKLLYAIEFDQFLTFAQGFGYVHGKRISEVTMLGSNLQWIQYGSALILILVLALNGACCLSPCCRMRRRYLEKRHQSHIQPVISLGTWLFVSMLPHLAFADDVVSDLKATAKASDGNIPQNVAPQNVALSSDDQRKIMLAIYAGIGSFQLVIGAIVVCILGMHGACCLCPKSEQQRLIELMKRNKDG